MHDVMLMETYMGRISGAQESKAAHKEKKKQKEMILRDWVAVGPGMRHHIHVCCSSPMPKPSLMDAVMQAGRQA